MLSISKSAYKTCFEPDKKYYQSLLRRFITILGMMSLSVGATAQTTSNISSGVYFYGNNNSPNKPGGEYIVFKLKNKTAIGLVYVQNSDVFSCFKGNYNQVKKQFNQVNFAYLEMGEGTWIIDQSQEPLNLSDFPYILNYNQISEGGNNIFKECLNVL